MSVSKTKKADLVSVARAARVSPATVSRAFNHPELVKASTRKRIENAVRKLGYIRNRAAQTIHGIRSGTIGLIVPTIDHTIFADVIQAFSDTVDTSGFTILLASHGYDLEREYQVLRKLLEHRVDGIALVGLDHTEDVFQMIEHQSVPSVLIWNYEPESRLPCVGTDNHQAGWLIAQHLVSLGHRKIATMFPPTQGNDRAQHRLDGVLGVLSQNGCTPKEDWQVVTNYSLSAAKRSAMSLLQAHSDIQAVICGNDIVAWGAIYAAKALGLSIPSDISIVGVGDFKGSQEMEPALTTIRLPAQEIGQLAGSSLVHRILAADNEIQNHLILPKLVVRSTCGTPDPS